jgi:FkbM family methyltransferase
VNAHVKNALHGLPAPVLRRLKVVRDQFAIRTFRPRTVVRVHGGTALHLRIADKMGELWYDRNMAELPEITFLKQRRLKPGALVFDLGAHQAVVALLLAKIAGESGRVIAVEAGKRNFDLAVENRSLNRASNLSVLRAVAAERSGRPVPFAEGLNGSVGPSGEKVISCTIDELSSKYGTPDVVMLDIEGYECRALEGATETLKSNTDWCVEVHAGCGLESYGGSSEQVSRLFRERGYSLYFRTDEDAQEQFRRMSTVPKGRFFLIACRE